MLKGTVICVHLLENRETTQANISKELDISLSTVNRTIKKLEKIGALEVKNRGLRVMDPEKILMHLANIRNLQKDIVYETRSDKPVQEIEKSMPAGTQFTAYTAYKHRFQDSPADYSEVYTYANKGAIQEIKKRFPSKKGPSNLIVLKKEPKIPVTNALIFADLWNLREWYAKEFVEGLRDRVLE